MLGKDGDAKLSDFGLAKYIGEDGLTSTICGSHSYTAPEIFSGRPYSAYLSDMWSLGVVLYAVGDARSVANLSVHPPRQAVFSTHIKQSLLCLDLISHLMNADPGSRLTATQALSHRWLSGVTSSTALPFEPQIVGLRRVDDFFEQEVEAPAVGCPPVQSFSSSQIQLTFEKLSRVIRPPQSDDETPTGMTRARTEVRSTPPRKGITTRAILNQGIRPALSADKASCILMKRVGIIHLRKHTKVVKFLNGDSLARYGHCGMSRPQEIIVVDRYQFFL
jgi:serine/threonine protein kinase